jgi:hypothetical protein
MRRKAPSGSSHPCHWSGSHMSVATRADASLSSGALRVANAISHGCRRVCCDLCFATPHACREQVEALMHSALFGSFSVHTQLRRPASMMMLCRRGRRSSCSSISSSRAAAASASQQPTRRGAGRVGRWTISRQTSHSAGDQRLARPPHGRRCRRTCGGPGQALACRSMTGPARQPASRPGCHQGELLRSRDDHVSKVSCPTAILKIMQSPISCVHLLSHRRSDDEREYRPPRRSRQFDDEDDEPSERELDTIRAEYMGFPPRADIQKAR